jgi:hypothetical protein
MRKLVFVAAMAMAGVAAAEPIDGTTAKKALFAPVKAEVEVLASAGLPKDQAAALEIVGGQQLYYGAIAISPDEGLMSAATVAAANYHDTDAASKVALADCNAKKIGKTACVVAALIRPKGWKNKGFQLSSDATAGFRADATGALAVSPQTGAWGLGVDADAATKACAARNEQAKDCRVVIAN